MTPDGLQNPTLYVKPGDHLAITVTNNLPPATGGSMGVSAPNCGAPAMNSASMNIHYHGTNTSPTCHQDEVIKTIINPGQTFQYNVAFPANEPPGLYWYHPHIHGIAEHAVQGGAAGAIVVQGIEAVQPAVSGLRQRILMVRDQNVPGTLPPMGNVPSWDVTLNYVPITSPSDPNSNNFVPAILQMQAGDREFFRVANSSADTILDLQYVFDGRPQVLQVVAIDGVAVNSQEGPQPGGLIGVTDFVLAPAGRVEFIVSAPPRSVQLAQLVTLGINTGPLGDNDPQRPLATIQLTDEALSRTADSVLPASPSVNTTSQRFRGLDSAPIAVRRTVYFDENCPPIPDPKNPCTPGQFFMAVVGKPEHIFDPNLPPDIVATQGTVEEWTIQNRAGENHEFHFHQLHFLVKSQDNFETNGSVQSPAVTGQYLDMIQVPYWDGNPEHPYPSVTARIDFRGPDIGEFVFHCHILNHEDLGMMNIIQVISPQEEDNLRGARAATDVKPGRTPLAAAEASPDALEIADRVVPPAGADKAAVPTMSGHHH
ncbi:MAG TPA: multicopper oxidase domain-containing protein [Bryobacteraceae bacterium]|jgi:FtsP/CotA-like multicopper oxidase with cupredoxin domain|nr:multicopper oxidase domain-containing protein [Bryobacteraceae bacterium]